MYRTIWRKYYISNRILLCLSIVFLRFLHWLLPHFLWNSTHEANSIQYFSWIDCSRSFIFYFLSVLFPVLLLFFTVCSHTPTFLTKHRRFILFFLAKAVLFKTKIHSKTKKPPLYVFLILYPFLLILFFTSSYYSSGWSSAQSQRTFYLLNDTQVVLYETSETFYTARCRISGNELTIDTHIQGAYPRTGHEVYVQTFDSVSLRN